ncbi:MAG: hypothetical protein JNL58_30720 [Planctomyces sp.]|nr:hypothetical protein [Planctomyces sp.]
MDPLAAWKELLDALAELDWERVLETAENLLEWITYGGFPPEVIALTDNGQNHVDQKIYVQDLNRSLVELVCCFAIRLAKRMLKNKLTNRHDVPFRLSCVVCNADSLVSFGEAIRVGWTRIGFVPESPVENLLGLCPQCRTLDVPSQ